MILQDAASIESFIGKFQWIMLFDASRYVIGVSFMFLIIYIISRTSLRVRRIQRRKPGLGDMRREVIASAASIFVFALVATPTSWLPKGHVMAHKFIPAENPWQVAAFVFLLMIAHDTWFYWTHRMMHHRFLYKRFHRLHHRSVAPSPFASYAFNIPEAAIQTLFFVPWLAFVPTPLVALFIFLAILMLRNVWAHSGFELLPSGFVDHWFWGNFATTVHHDMHHNGGFNTNFGLYFTWWDRLMGTEHPQYKEEFRAVTGRTAPCLPGAELQSADSESSRRISF